MGKLEIPMRINVINPPTGVSIKVQKGRAELLPPAKASKKALIFDFSITADLSSATPNFLGQFAQGTKNARFVYVNSGTYAGQSDSPWSRRAKISLMGITRDNVREVSKSPGSRLEITFEATGGRDDGPVCGSIRLPDGAWKIMK